jgi:hypothetical protein
VIERQTPRADARALGRTYYFTNKQCKRGHTALRRVSDGACVACARLLLHRWNEANPERRQELRAEWLARNPQIKVHARIFQRAKARLEL